MNVFRFKQFEVDQTGCAMKINTDGVLLAAMAESKQAVRILDIGTGTGVMALMMAQRFPAAQVHAVEIDAIASAAAGKNFSLSAFRERLFNHHTAIQDFKPTYTFDILISNPPFFVNDLRNREERKGTARHASRQFFVDLMAKAAALLHQEGCFWFILPPAQASFLIKEAERHGFSVWKKILLHSDSAKPAFRWIIALKRAVNTTEMTHFYIYENEKIYTEAYKDRLKDFFLGY